MSQADQLLDGKAVGVFVAPRGIEDMEFAEAGVEEGFFEKIKNSL